MRSRRSEPPAGERSPRTSRATATPNPTRPERGSAHIEALERFVSALDPGPVALVTHDWGVMVGLRWACENPERVDALVISDGGFFADRRWHDFANVMRTPGEGEQLIAGFTRDGFAQMMKGLSSGIGDDAVDDTEGLADETRELAAFELYRLGHFENSSLTRQAGVWRCQP